MQYSWVLQDSSVMRASGFSSFFVTFSLILMLSPTAQPLESYPTANLSTTWPVNDFLGNRSILLRETKVGQFGCGFYCEEYCTSYFFAIFFWDQVIWSADYPVGKNAILNFTADGELVLTDIDGSIAWTTNSTGKLVAGMNLTDTGNLVLFDHQNSVVWQSFDHPTDTLLPGQKLLQDQKLISVDPSENMYYYLQVTNKGVFAYVKPNYGYYESNSPQAYYSRFVYPHGNDTNEGKGYIRFLNGSLSLYIHSTEPSDPDDVIGIPPASSAQYMKLMPDGHLQVFERQLEHWVVVADLLTDKTAGLCDNYLLSCGRNSVCLNNLECSCPAVEYFIPVNDRQPDLGCSEITPLSCSSKHDQDFITLEIVKYLPPTSSLQGMSEKTCKQACLKDCACKAAFFQYDSNASIGKCFITSDIFTISTNDSLDYNSLALIKVQNDRSSHQVATIVGSTIGSFVLLLVVIIGFITYVVHNQKRDAEMEEEYLDQVPGMATRFSYEELKTATGNFSKKLGEGGFGSVFEGSLQDGSKIAVKCLEGLLHIKKSFLAEVQSIGSIHHVNLVRLRGFCTWRAQRFLVYDLLSNGSLDKWIYHGVREQILEWERRKKIILDIAKGLAYLHEDCRQKIIHRSRNSGNRS